MASKTRILIAEDNADLGHVLKTILSKKGYAVEVVKDGYEALTYLRRRLPHVVILDLMMPEKSGIEIFSTIRGMAPNTKIVIYTAIEEYENSIYARKADRFLIKGESGPDELLKTISELTT